MLKQIVKRKAQFITERQVFWLSPSERFDFIMIDKPNFESSPSALGTICVNSCPVFFDANFPISFFMLIEPSFYICNHDRNLYCISIEAEMCNKFKVRMMKMSDFYIDWNFYMESLGATDVIPRRSHGVSPIFFYY